LFISHFTDTIKQFPTKVNKDEIILLKPNKSGSMDELWLGKVVNMKTKALFEWCVCIDGSWKIGAVQPSTGSVHISGILASFCNWAGEGTMPDDLCKMLKYIIHS